MAAFEIGEFVVGKSQIVSGVPGAVAAERAADPLCTGLSYLKYCVSNSWARF